VIYIYLRSIGSDLDRYFYLDCFLGYVTMVYQQQRLFWKGRMIIHSELERTREETAMTYFKLSAWMAEEKT
jgi:hypothetical protein